MESRVLGGWKAARFMLPKFNRQGSLERHFMLQAFDIPQCTRTATSGRFELFTIIERFLGHMAAGYSKV